MSCVNGQLVTRGRPFGRGKQFEFNFYPICQEVKSRKVHYKMHSASDHWLSLSCLATCWSQEDEDEYLVEACPECRNIRIYDSEDLVEEFAFENVRHSCICSGPDGTIFVWGHMKLLHLFLDGTRFRLLSTWRCLDQGGRKVPMAEEIASMCYTEACNIITLLADCSHSYDRYDLIGVLWPEGVVIWEYCGSLNGESLYPQDVACTPQSHVCIANTTNVLLLDPKNGSLISVLLKSTT